MPGSVAGLQTLTIGQPTSDELLVAGGNFITELADNQVIFTDVGLVPMKFDILVDGTGRVYKSPDVIYCNTALDTLGSSPQNFTIQPSAPSRLRVAISNFNTGYTQVRFLITGLDEAGGNISETVTFNGPAPSPVQTSFTEVVTQRRFTEAVFAQVNQMQVQVRNGDGPNTTVTVFAEQSPERPGTQDDLLLGTVHWTGSEINDLYSNDADVAIDRRLVTVGGGTNGLSPIHSALNQPMLVDTVAGYLPAGSTQWATIVEDFNDPTYMVYPNDEFFADLSLALPVELTGNSLGSRRGYISRKITLGNSFPSNSLDSLWLRMIPRHMRGFPTRLSNNWSAQVLLYTNAPGVITANASLGTNPYPPYQCQLTYSGTGANIYAARILIFTDTENNSLATMKDLHEAFQGFVFHIRS